ncbi:MAG: hypothetical protein Q9224_004992 [Gallowayella concinna]
MYGILKTFELRSSAAFAEPLDDVVSTRYTKPSRTVSVDLCIVDAKKDIKMTPIQQPNRSPSPVNNRPAGSTPLNSHSSGESQWSHDVGRELKGMAPLQHVSPVNLLGVNAKRLVDFVGASHLLPSSICKLGLSGIRQIKFVASEAQWLERIGDRRAEELRHLFRSFILRTTLVAIWALGPVMISAVALSVHTILTGRLSASVAFTSLAALSQMESALAIIPKLVVHMLEDAVSATRIEGYLDSAEIANNAEHGDTVSMVNASVSRPSHSTAQIRSTFVPRSADIVFTSGKLNVISGVSGSGKSLLLAAIVGERETVSGAMRLPKSMKYKDDLRLLSKDWIVPGSIAFVAQFRWIENDSVRGNIVSGLPFDLDRYTKVLHACALNHDLHVLPDGDLTDVGFGGVNPSGGQKWRVSFALAMYSRAEILVLDDILSAVDVHAGRHLVEHALCGDLRASRTRILATHHVQLCSPFMDCHVILGGGGVQDVQYPARTHRLSSLNVGAARTPFVDSQVPNESVPKLRSYISTDIHPCDHAAAKATVNMPVANVCLEAQDGKSKAPVQVKKFVDAKTRESGLVKYSVYRDYITAAGGFWVVSLVLVAHIGWVYDINPRQGEYNPFQLLGNHILLIYMKSF